MSSLYVKRLLDFGVGREKEVNKDQGWDEEREEGFCSGDQLNSGVIDGRGGAIFMYLWDAALRPMVTARTIITNKRKDVKLSKRPRLVPKVLDTLVRAQEPNRSFG